MTAAPLRSACKRAEAGEFSKHGLQIGTRRETRLARPAAGGAQPRSRPRCLGPASIHPAKACHHAPRRGPWPPPPAWPRWPSDGRVLRGGPQPAFFPCALPTSCPTVPARACCPPCWRSCYGACCPCIGNNWRFCRPPPSSPSACCGRCCCCCRFCGGAAKRAACSACCAPRVPSPGNCCPGCCCRPIGSSMSGPPSTDAFSKARLATTSTRFSTCSSGPSGSANATAARNSPPSPSPWPASPCKSPPSAASRGSPSPSP